MESRVGPDMTEVRVFDAKECGRPRSACPRRSWSLTGFPLVRGQPVPPWTSNLRMCTELVCLELFLLFVGFVVWFLVVGIIFRFLWGEMCFWDSSTQNHAEPSWNYLRKSVLDPKRGKLDQKSGFWHLVSVSWSWGTLGRELGEPKCAATSHSPLRYCKRTL